MPASPAPSLIVHTGRGEGSYRPIFGKKHAKELKRRAAQATPAAQATGLIGLFQTKLVLPYLDLESTVWHRLSTLVGKQKPNSPPSADLVKQLTFHRLHTTVDPRVAEQRVLAGKTVAIRFAKPKTKNKFSVEQRLKIDKVQRYRMVLAVADILAAGAIMGHDDAKADFILHESATGIQGRIIGLKQCAVWLRRLVGDATKA